MARLAGVVLALTITVVWFVVGLGLLAVISLEQLSGSSGDCPVPGVDSLYGDSSWQWWPPGEVCSINGVEFSGPSALRGGVIVGEIVVGVGLVFLWRRLRDAPDPDWTA